MHFQMTGPSGAVMENSGVLKEQKLSIKNVLVSGSTHLVIEDGNVISDELFFFSFNSS